MKNFLLCILLIVSSVVYSQTIDNPTFKARNNSIYNITRIERTPENTRVYIHALFRPKWWIKVESNHYLEDAATGKQYKLRSAENFELDKQVYMPESGEKDFVLIFEPLPKEIKTIHFIGPDSGESNTYDLSLMPQDKTASTLNNLKGNWYRTNNSRKWEYGIYDSITIMQNRIYTNESIRRKRKTIELTVKDKLTGTLSTLSLTPGKDGKCKIQANEATGLLYTKEVAPITNITADNGFGNFFQTDSACLQGYIDGYDRRVGAETGIMYLSDELTNNDYPIVVPIEANGSFQCKFPVHYPICASLILNHISLPFYIEPGKTLTMYINWEDFLDLNRARDRSYPIKSTAYMGPLAEMSYLSRILKDIPAFNHEAKVKAQKELTPGEFKEFIRPVIARWEEVRDSLVRIYAPSAKATRLIENEISIKTGVTLFDFLMSRSYYAKQDTTNRALKVKEDDTYYDFLKRIPLNDETMLTNSESRFFINRLEFMNPLQNAYSYSATDSISYTYAQKPVLSYLKEKGVKLNAMQDSIRQKHEKLAGTRTKILLRDLAKENILLQDLYKKEENLIKAYQKNYQKQNSAFNTKMQPIEKDRERLEHISSIWLKKDKILYNLTGERNPFLWQIMKTHSLKTELRFIQTDLVAREYVNLLQPQLSHPILTATAEQLLKETHPEEGKKSYRLPEGKGTDIFRNIIKNHPGKVLFVDFWATTCAPCRSGIESTAELRKKYKNHPEFQFIYISGASESPERAYKQYVEKHLKGEACYYVSDTEFKYLHQLFQFNGIPHYELVEKDGTISKESLDTYNIKRYLENRFSIPNKTEKESLQMP